MFNSNTAQDFIKRATSSHLDNLKRHARKSSKLKQTNLNMELDLIAHANGFTNWSLLVKSVNSCMSEIKTESIETQVARLNSGLVLIGGVSGSGRTTLVNQIVSEILKYRPAKIINIGRGPWDDITSGFKYGYVLNKHIGEHTQSLESGVYESLRQAPDVILVSELYGSAGIESVLTAAETGHLVIGVRNSTDHHGLVKGLLNQIFDRQPEVIEYQKARMNACLKKTIITTRTLNKVNITSKDY